MLKLAGAVFLMLGAAGLGFGAAAQLQARVTALRSLVSALEQMERELSFRLTPMPELLERLAGQASAPASLFFARCRESLGALGQVSLGELWRKSLDEEMALLLSEEEKRMLYTLGDVLGRYDGDGQCAALRVAVADLGQCVSRAEGERSRMGRVYGTLGLGGGAMLVILLM